MTSGQNINLAPNRTQSWMRRTNEGAKAKIGRIRNESDIARRAPGQPSSGTPDVFGQALAFFFQRPASALPVRPESTTIFGIHRSSGRQTSSASRRFALVTTVSFARRVYAPARSQTTKWELPDWHRTGPDQD